MPDHTVPADNVFLEDALNQRAVYWHPIVAGDEGIKTYEEPVEIVCHWQMVVETFLIRASGDMATSRSKVLVDRDLAELGVLWLPPDGGIDLEEGQALALLDDESDPLENDGAFEIRRFDRIPNYEGDEFVRTAYL